jgi:hypothetical protein
MCNMNSNNINLIQLNKVLLKINTFLVVLVNDYKINAKKNCHLAVHHHIYGDIFRDECFMNQLYLII